MKKNVMLTVNVITYNHEKWIGQCLDSILAQKTNFDFVIRIFEDCSTDKTADICREYKEKYPDKIKLHLADVNLGVFKNPLRSYENITTPYLMYIEGDDYICNNKRFQMQIDALEKHKDCSFCCGITIEIDSDSDDYDDNLLPYLNKILRVKDDLIDVIMKPSKKISLHCVPILNEGIYTQSWIVKHWDTHIFSYLLSRIIRTDCIDINKGNTYYLGDNTQLFELLQMGNMFYFREVFGISRHTGKGFISGKSNFEQLEYVWGLLHKYNSYTKGKFSKNLLALVGTAAFYYCSFDKPLKKDTAHNLTFKKIKRYFIPRFILDIFLIPRNISRFYRKNFKGSKKNVKIYQ